MASEDSIINEGERQELDDTTTCCICTNVYTDPKLLPCMHTFCMICIQECGHKTNKGPGDQMPCPICRRLFKIPLEGFQELSSNSYIEKLIQVGNPLEHSALSKDICDACLEENEGDDREQIPLADAFCVECRQKLCEECCRHHRKLKLTKNHELMPMKELQKSLFGESVMSNLALSVCELHERRDLDVYCVNCDAVVCAICFIDDHKNHEGSHVSKFVSDFRQQIEIHTESMNECSAQAKRMKSKLLKIKEDMQQKVESLESEVVNRNGEIKELLDAHAHSILQDLSLLQRNKLKEIQVAADEVDSHLSGLDSFKTRCHEVLAKGSPCHICKSISNLSATATQLRQQSKSLVEQESQAFTACFKKSELEEFLRREGGNLIGEIKEERDPDSKDSSNCEKQTYKAIESAVEKLRQELKNEKESYRILQVNFDELQQKIVAERSSAKTKLEKTKSDYEELISKLEHSLDRGKQEREKLVLKAQEDRKALAERRYKSDPVLVQSIGTISDGEQKREISGLATLDKELFVVSRKSSEVEVYELMKFTLCRRWNLKELISPEDVRSCKKNKCLYIFDSKNCSNSNEILRTDPNGKLIIKWSTGDDFGWNLSVTDESNVILTVRSKNKLNEYSPDGKLLREITLSSVAGIGHPWHAIKLVNGNFLVSHGRDRDEQHRVCIVDAKSNIEMSFGGQTGLFVGRMNEPVRLAIDGNGFVMVIDLNNSRVLLLDSDLKFKKEILSKKSHGLQVPCAIALDESSGRLIVADNRFMSATKLFKYGPILIFEF